MFKNINTLLFLYQLTWIVQISQLSKKSVKFFANKTVCYWNCLYVTKTQILASLFELKLLIIF